MATLNARLDKLEAATQPGSPYPWPLMPGCNRLSVLVLRGPDEQAELERLRARGYAAELATQEQAEMFLG